MIIIFLLMTTKILMCIMEEKPVREMSVFISASALIVLPAIYRETPMNCQLFFVNFVKPLCPLCLENRFLKHKGHKDFTQRTQSRMRLMSSLWRCTV